MVRLLILFLIRVRLGLKKGELFQFENQRYKTDWYYFTDINVMKAVGPNETRPDPFVRPSNVSLNWLLDDRCTIIKKEV